MLYRTAINDCRKDSQCYDNMQQSDSDLLNDIYEYLFYVWDHNLTEIEIKAK